MFSRNWIFNRIAIVLCLLPNQFILFIMRNSWRTFVNTFKPSYNVDVTMFLFVPGFPVKANRTRHSFKKGAYNEARLFFERASRKTRQHNVAPVEINFVKGKKRIMISRHFGPVKSLKKLRMSA